MNAELALSEEMLALARGAARPMGPGFARALAFVRSRLNADGGFAGRDGRSDLYYTAFALDALAAGGAAELPSSVAVFVRAIEDVADLDLAHLACLVRCWDRLGLLADPTLAHGVAAVRGRLFRYRTPSDGFSTVAGAAVPSVAGAFFALAICGGIGLPPRGGNGAGNGGRSACQGPVRLAARTGGSGLAAATASTRRRVSRRAVQSGRRPPVHFDGALCAAPCKRPAAPRNRRGLHGIFGRLDGR